MSASPDALAAVFHITSSSGQFPLPARPTLEGGVIVRLPQPASAPSAQYALPPTKMRRFAAAHRYEPFWMKPAVGTRDEEVPPETQVLFVELEDGQVGLLVPLAGGPAGGDGREGSRWRCALQGIQGGGLSVVADCGVDAAESRAGGGGGEFAALYVASGPRDRLHEMIRRAAREVARQLGTTLREEKRLPAFVNDFGWCTWDAFYQEVSQEKVREGLESFRGLGIQPRFVILDDGWQTEASLGDEKGHRLTQLKANEKFGHDLTPTTRMAREEFGVRTFLVWHAFQGYWGGISAEQLQQYHAVEVARDYSRGILHYMPEANTNWWGTTAGIIPPAGIHRFFDDYHRSLAAQGVDGVKVDNQAALEAFAAIEPAGRTALYRIYHEALETSVAQNFAAQDQPLINCMSCANDLLYAYQHSALTRTSADFYPQHPHLHGMHLWTNALVATWFGHFIHPDWDMFHSQHPFASFHAAARAFSGGPIYVSDKPGHHDADLLRKLVLSDGTVLRPDRPATLTADALFTDPVREPAPLKIWSTSGNAGLLGLFNCHHEPGADITATARPADVPLLARADQYAVYAHRAAALQIIAATDAITFELPPAQYELLTIVPMTDGMAVLGLLDKFISPGAVLSQTGDIPSSHGPRTLQVAVRDGGILGVCCLRPPTSVRSAGRPLLFDHEGSLLTVTLPAAGAQEIEIQWSP